MTEKQNAKQQHERDYVEEPFLKQLEGLKWTAYRQEPGGTLRSGPRQVILDVEVRKKIKELNSWLTDEQLDQVMRDVFAPSSRQSRLVSEAFLAVRDDRESCVFSRHWRRRSTPLARMAAISRRRCGGVIVAGSSSMSVIAGSLRKRPQRLSLGDRLAVWRGYDARLLINYPARVRNDGRSRKQPGRGKVPLRS